MKRPALHVNTHFLSQKKVWGTLLLIAVAIGAYYIFSRKEKPAEEFAIVATMKAEQNDVGVYGEYVGRIHCLSSTNGNIRQKSTKPRLS